MLASSMMLGSDEVKVCICARSSFTEVLLDALTGTGSGTQRQRVAPALAPAWRADPIIMLRTVSPARV